MSTSAAGRRVRFGTLTAILLLAATASMVVANILAARVSFRLDATSTREHQISPRSADLIGRLRGEYEVVIAAPLRDRAATDPRALDRVRGVLDQFSRHAKGQARITPTLIDTGSPDGIAAFEKLLTRLADRERETIKRQTDALTTAAANTAQLAEWLDALSPRLQTVRGAIPEGPAGAATNRSYFDQRATESRLNADSLRALAAAAKKSLEQPAAQTLVPDIDGMAAPLRQPIADLESGLTDIAENLRRFAAAESVPAAARDAAKPLADHVAQGRATAGAIRDSLDRITPTDFIRIARTIQAGSAVVIIGPSGVTAIDLTQLLPPPAAMTDQSGVRADIGRNAEELIATAVGTLAQPIKPIVVIVHGQPTRGLLQSDDFIGMLDRLALRGMDVAEWAATIDAEPPALARVDPTGKRPVVYIALGTDTAKNPERGQSGPERAARLGKSLASVAAQGRPILISLNPSTLPTFGEPDPTLACLSGFGLTADTGRPLLKESFTGGGRRVETSQGITASDSDHPIARAVRGLPTRFEWPVAISTITATARGATEPPSPQAQSTPLYTINDRSVWAESQWLNLWQARNDPRGTSINQPSRDSKGDGAAGPWTIVSAATRPHAAGPDQRLVVVGSNTWFMDRIAQERILIDGHPAATSPGNAELFEACIYWLAGQDEMIAPSATARAVPLIRPLGGGTLLALRWLAIAGLPGAVLLAGMIWRLLRG